MSLKVSGVRAGDEVIVSDFSFPATANVVEDIGAIPVFADVDLTTYNMLPAELDRNISSKTRAVIFVDAFGNPSGISNIMEICKERGVVLVEDAACALGSSKGTLKCGNIADITCFSFHPRKLLTTGEGGAITINDDTIAQRLEVKLDHGGHVTEEGKWSFADFGYNYRMSELQAAMGSAQIAKLDLITASRREILNQYIDGLKGLGFKPQRIEDTVQHNVQSVVFTTPEGISRDHLIKYLRANEIETTIGTYCLSNLPYYLGKFGTMNPNARNLERNTITLPCYDGAKVNEVIDQITLFCGKCVSNDD